MLRGPGGVFEFVEHTLDKKGSCVLVVAEGAVHEIYGSVDIGCHIINEAKEFFAEKGREIGTKYLDPYVLENLRQCQDHGATSTSEVRVKPIGLSNV